MIILAKNEKISLKVVKMIQKILNLVKFLR